MTEHPSAQLLERFALGELSPGEAGPVVFHLLRDGGCGRCRARLAPLFHLLVDPGAHTAAHEPSDLELDRYGAAIESAAAAVRLHGRKTVRLRSRTRQLLAELAAHGVGRVSARTRGSYPKYEAVLRHSWSLRHSDPQRMVDFAYLATRMARNLGRDGYDAMQVADFEARAWGELANACRVAERFAEAESAMAKAFALFAAGTKEPLLEARLFDLRASQLGLQGQYGFAIRLLDAVHDLYLRHHDRHSAGRALIKKGFYTGYSGEPAAALELIDRGLAMIDPQVDPTLADLAAHNQIDLLVECGRLREARTLLWHNRARISAVGETLRLKLEWLEGRINAGLGQLARAERALFAAKEGFSQAGSARYAAVAALDLTTVWMRQGHLAEAHALAEEAIDLLLALGGAFPRDAMTALVVLRGSFRAALATVAQVQGVADFLRRAEHDPGARYLATPP